MSVPRKELAHVDRQAAFAPIAAETLQWLSEQCVPSVDEQVERIRSAQKRWHSAGRGVLVAIAVMGCAALLVALFRPAANLTFMKERDPGQLGELIGDARAPRTLSFNDGTQIVVQADSRARVMSTSPHGAQVLLERGALHASVVHRKDTRWTISAGQFVIQVTGTAFSATWDVSRERLRVDMDEGSVSVGSPCAPDHDLKAGESFEWSCPRAQAPADVLPAASESPVAHPSAPLRAVPLPVASVATAAPSSSHAANEAKSSASPAAEVQKPRPDWRSEAMRARYPEAWSIVLSNGQLDLPMSAQDTLLLANVARLSNHPADATRLYRTVRARFAGSHEAAIAAFHLARLSRAAESLVWLETYLREEPNGSFAADAFGRLIEIDVALGQAEGARLRAGAYLKRYPSGAHAAYARSVTGP